MKKLNIYLATIAIIILSTYSNQAQAQTDFIVIVNKNVKEESLTQSNIRRIYFGFTTQWKNFERVKPSYMEIPNNAFWNFVSTEESKFKSYWTKRVFSGNGVAPVGLADAQKVVDYVSSTSGAIGILPSDFKGNIGDQCRVIEIK